MEAQDRIQRMHDQTRQREQSAKRRVWDSLQRECPELAERMGEFARLGVAGVACSGDVWGRVDEQDREWIGGEA